MYAASKTDSFKFAQRNIKSASILGSTTQPFPNAINYTIMSEYVLGSNLGSGAYAIVKQAIHKETGMQLAIKVYEKFKLHSNQMVKKSVSREIKLLSMLCNTERTSEEVGFGHPNIMKLYDAFETSK